ncbi:MAG: bifunctional diguanylate cyclase/phosphodiesterase [Sulfurospirillaceae bacterium]|nr:bifunctional diguanylate cyclase/phosphodiesterase [Sulfurospirillaceae bacterium]
MIKEIKLQQEHLEHTNETLEFNVFEKTKELQKLNFSLEIKNKELEENYLIDTLTKLPNRNMFTKEFAFASFPQVFLIDIDGFKHINDFYGTEIGDITLVEFALFIREFAQNHEMKAYRLSSDEFLLLFDKRFNQDVAESILKQLCIELSLKHFKAYEDAVEFQVNVTCGIAHGKNSVLEKADVALNFAKNKKIAFAIYDEENLQMNQHKQNIYWRQKIQIAIANDTIVPYFQKIVNTLEPSKEKYECLMRLVDEDKVFGPNLFLDVAKETRLYDQLTRIMIKKCFEKFTNTTISFSMNISLLDIENTKTMEFLEEQMLRYNVAQQLIIELVESEDIMSSSQFLAFVHKMKSYGVRFALDDFGSGYSNFAFVLTMAPTYLKIDGSLIKNIIEDKNSNNVVQAIVALSKEINAEVIAEFVEKEQQVYALQSSGVHLLQGYYFSIPSNSLAR